MRARLMMPYVVECERASDDGDSVEQSKRQMRVSRIHAMMRMMQRD